MKFPAIFLDRDGILVIPITHKAKGYAPRKLEDFKYYDDAYKSIKAIQQSEYLSIVVSNQPDFADGSLPISILETMSRKLISELGVDDVYNCTHSPLGDCECRKPKSGMFLKAAECWNIDLNRSWMIGDRDSDIESGKNAGCQTIFIQRNWAAESGKNSDYQVLSLYEAIGIIGIYQQNL